LYNWNSRNSIAIFSIGDVPEHGISLQDFKHPMIFWQNVEESCMFREIYGVGMVKLQIKWPGSLEKNTNLVENLKDIN